jgi:hypothetical protein
MRMRVRSAIVSRTMRPQRRMSDQALQAIDRRAREDSAPRLLEEVPELVSLRLEITQGRTESGTAKHARTIVVEHAPALFEMACIERTCRNGGHDLTFVIMSALRQKMASFEGEDVCRGSVGTAECSSRLSFQATAIYRDD